MKVVAKVGYSVQQKADWTVVSMVEHLEYPWVAKMVDMTVG